MRHEYALMLDAIRIMDFIEKHGSFAAAANELGKVPSSLSYSMQKLEDDLNVILFDRSGHRVKFTKAGRLLLEKGRLLLNEAEKIRLDVKALANGWESHLTIVCEISIPSKILFPLINKLDAISGTQVSILTGVLSGSWELLDTGKADIVISSDRGFKKSSEFNCKRLSKMRHIYVAAPEHSIHKDEKPNPINYSGIVIADTTSTNTALSVHILDKQKRLTVSNLEDKRMALLDGLGVATMPYWKVKDDIENGKLKIVNNGFNHYSNIVVGWHRGTMGKAKTWCIKEVSKLFNSVEF
ncbi:LysR family transcriptional regulator [Providencia stuartii]|uniref:LysR family transcriptional regulator n=1 Tax=Providencia stuartii TaxID=588 RepID=UPI00111E2C1F|nr:LysR family transcriptional regulator [Providencia stuartii]